MAKPTDGEVPITRRAERRQGRATTIVLADGRRITIRLDTADGRLVDLIELPPGSKIERPKLTSGPGPA